MNGNGSGRGLGYEVNGSVEVLLNGNGAGNGSLVKYEEGNGAAASSGGGSEERRRKERVEEIGREDAWFKNGRPQPEV